MDERSTDSEKSILAVVPPDHSEWKASGPTTRQLLYLTVSFWTVEVFLAELRSIVDHSVKLELYTFLRLLSAAFGCLQFYLIHRVAQVMARRTFLARGIVILALAALAGVVNLKTIDALQNLSAFPVSDYGIGWRIYNATYWAMMFMAWAAIYLAFDYSREAVLQERRARVLEQLAYEAQLCALRFQIDPHFLFNTLNSVSALILEKRYDDAEGMIDRLAEFFRTTLVTNPHEDLPLCEEIDLQRIYLEIEKVRFPQLRVEIEVHPDAATITVPALLLQPLVENAVKFAMAGHRGSATVGVRASLLTTGLAHIEVWDDGKGLGSKNAKGTGTGLDNVRKRLRVRFGDDANLTVLPRSPSGVSVSILLPSRAMQAHPAVSTGMEK